MPFLLFAGESSLPSVNPKKKNKKVARKVTPVQNNNTSYNDYYTLRSTTFSSSVEGRSNSWRATARQEGRFVHTSLKTGTWDRPDSRGSPSVWMSSNIDWSRTLDSRPNRALEFSFEFGQSTPGITAIIRFGASSSSRSAVRGDHALELVYGQTDCTFSIDQKKTSGNLPFAVTNGTKVRIIILQNRTAEIYIDDTAILADQKIDFDENYLSISAEGRDFSQPEELVIREIGATFIKP